MLPIEELYGALGVGSERASGRQYLHSDIIKRVMESSGWQKKRIRKPERSNSSSDKRDNRTWVYIRSAEQEAGCNTWWKFDAEKDHFVEDVSNDFVCGSAARKDAYGWAAKANWDDFK